MTELTHQGDVSGNRGKANMDLIERLEKAVGPDRELDAELFLLDRGFTRIVDDQDSTGIRSYAWAGSIFKGEITDQHRPAYTSSVDSALALVERKLPGQRVAFEKMSDYGFCVIGFNTDDEVDATAATLPLAILIALLKALNSDSSNAP